MRILHVTLGFYPAQSWGGPVKSVYLLGREQARRGHHVTVYCTNLFNKKRKIQWGTFQREMDGIHVTYFHTWNLPWWPGTLGPIWVPGVAGTINQDIKNFDVIHLHGYRGFMNLPVASAARKNGVPFVIQPRGTMPILINSFWQKRLYDQLLGNKELEGLSALIALQESECGQAMSYGVAADRIHVIPNGVDPEDRKNAPEPGSFRQKFGLDPNKVLILFMGRVNKIKGTDMLIEAFAKSKHTNTQLAIAGPDDGQMEEIKALISQYGLTDRVVLTGLLRGPEVMGAYQDADLYVLPSRKDSFPNTLIEACLLDKPMVVTEGCEIAHLVKDRVADVVPFDAQAFADAIDVLLTDRERYERYQRNCREVISDTFSIRTIVSKLETVYENAIAEKRASS